MIKNILLTQLEKFGWINNKNDFSVVVMSDISFNKKFKNKLISSDELTQTV